MREWLLELGKAIAWLFLFLFTYALLLAGATFVVHSWYALERHQVLGLPNLGIQPDEGPQATQLGTKMLVGGIVLLAASVVSGRICLRIMKKAIASSKLQP